MATEDYNIGWADATGNGWNPVDRRGAEFEHYSKGFTDCCNRAKPHRLFPLDDFTVTRPDPSRAEMAAMVLAQVMGRTELSADSREDMQDQIDTKAHFAVYAADALIAALEKAKP
jgi:hypothetical protein